MYYAKIKSEIVDNAYMSHAAKGFYSKILLSHARLLNSPSVFWWLYLHSKDPQVDIN